MDYPSRHVFFCVTTLTIFVCKKLSELYKGVEVKKINIISKAYES